MLLGRCRVADEANGASNDGLLYSVIGVFYSVFAPIRNWLCGREIVAIDR